MKIGNNSYSLFDAIALYNNLKIEDPDFIHLHETWERIKEVDPKGLSSTVIENVVDFCLSIYEDLISESVDWRAVETKSICVYLNSFDCLQLTVTPTKQCALLL